MIVFCFFVFLRKTMSRSMQSFQKLHGNVVVVVVFTAVVVDDDVVVVML